MILLLKRLGIFCTYDSDGIIDDYIIFTNYDFVVEEDSFEPEKELDADEFFIQTTLKYALEVFENQNKII